MKVGDKVDLTFEVVRPIGTEPQDVNRNNELGNLWLAVWNGVEVVIDENDLN